MNMGYDKFIKGKENLGHYNLDYQIFDDDYEKKRTGAGAQYGTGSGEEYGVGAEAGVGEEYGVGTEAEAGAEIFAWKCI